MTYELNMKNYDDTFERELLLLMKKHKKHIGVGDEIRILDKLECYDTYVDFMDYLRDIELIGAHDAYRYAYAESPDDSHTFEVIALAPHLMYKDNVLLYVRDYINLKCYIMRESACVKVEHDD